MAQPDIPGRPGRGSVILGLGLVAVGAVFLFGQIFDVRYDFTWPFFIIIPGALLFLVAVTGGGPTAALMIPASISTATGLLLLYQNSTGHWESWAYAWALVAPGATGVGQMAYGWLMGRPSWVRIGSWAAATGAGLFLVGAVFFEGILGISGRDFGVAGRIGLPGVMIALGVLLLLANVLRSAPGRQG